MSGSPQHIVHLATGREWRGGQNQVFLLAQALQDFDDVNQVVVTTRDSELERRLRDARVPVRTAAWKAGLSPSALLAAIGVATEHTLIHAHDAHSVTLAAVAGLVTGARFLATRRSDFHLRRLWGWRRAERVIAISEAVRRILLADGLPGDRVPVVHSGIDIEAVRRAARELPANVEWPEDAPFVVNVAALSPHKDQRTLIRAAAVARSWIPNVQWVIIGEGPLRGELEALIRELGVSDSVRLLGQVPNPHPIVARANAFVMSSREEGLGTAILDAMALDIPVIGTDTGGIPELLAGGAGALVPPEHPEALAQAVTAVIQDRNLATRYTDRGRLSVARFSARGMAARVRAVYRSIDLKRIESQ